MSRLLSQNLQPWYLSYMQRIELNSEEIEVLRDVVQHTLTEIDVEIFRTDTHDFKERLKHRREYLEHIMAKLSNAQVAA